ncbi:MAG: M43 family zinc metalloprotease [Bacteroidota bacterium]
MKVPLSCFLSSPFQHHRRFSTSLMIGAMILTSFLQAQPRRNCGTMEHLEDQLDSNPNMLYDIRRIERDTELAAKSLEEDNSMITIPVVIHVVYNSATHNISDEQIYSQLRVLNEDFQRQNPDRIHTNPLFRDVATDTRIEFRLAELDPNGQPTNGITRTRTSRNLFYSSDNAVKYSAMGGVDPWPTGEYLNIWICNLGSGILGYSQFPGGPSETDGVVIGYRYFGTTGPVRPPFNRGRTTTHEVGHWLNLRHIWGDGPCGADDHVDDTPLAERPHHGCIEAAESCGSPDMVQNFMDYTDDACMNLFTSGQAARMRALFSAGGSRESIRYSRGLLPAQEESEPEPVITFFPPERLTVDGVTSSTATLSWEEIPGVDKYKVRVRKVGEQEWATRTFLQPFVNTNRLRSCTEYEFEVASLGTDIQSTFSNTFSFQTLGCTQAVADAGDVVPRNLHTTEIMGRQATLNWDIVPQATSYQVQYKQLGVKRVFTKLTYQPATVLYGLTTGERYLYRIRANFADGPGEYSKVSSFVPGSSNSNTLVSRQSSRMSREAGAYFRTYMDARTGSVTVEIDFYEGETVLISVFDASGREVESYDPFAIYAGEPFDLDLGHLPAGRYSIQLEDSDGFQHVKQIRKQ